MKLANCNKGWSHYTKKWDTLYLDTMKLNKTTDWNRINKSFKKFLKEAEEEKPAAEKEAPAEEEGGNPFAAGGEEGEEEGGNPFAAGGGEGEEEAPAAEEEPAADKKQTKPEEPAGIPLKFNISKVKRYNTADFLSDQGVVKSIDKKGIIVTTKPDDVDVLVNFSDISERVKRFFKNK